MSIDQLRSIALFDGLTDDQLRELLAVGEEVRFDIGDELFTEAQPADFWWLLLQGSVDLLRHVGQEDTRLGVMSIAGQWAGGFRAWDEHGVYMATGRGSSPGIALRVPADKLAERADAWFPFGAHLLRGLIHTARNIETMARQREALVALGTLAAGFAHEINNPASAATRAADALESSCEDLQSSLGRLAERSITARQFIALDTLRRGIDPPAAGSDPLAIADREDALSDWLAKRGVDRDWSSLRRWRRPGSTSPGARRRPTCSATTPVTQSGPAWSGSPAISRPPPCWPRSRSRPGESRSWSRR